MRRPMIWGVVAAVAFGTWCAALPFVAAADLLMAVPAADYLASSTLSTDNNTWQEYSDGEGLWDPAMTAPGAIDIGGGPDRAWLVYRMRVEVPAEEATDAGKTWQIWVHMRVPGNENSFHFQTSSDGETWLPEEVTNACRVDNSAMKDTDVWYWQDQLTGNAGAVDPVVAAGTNYLRIGSREANAEAATSPRFDMVALRNYGDLGQDNAPSGAEVLDFIEATAVEPRGKLALMWAGVKAER